MKIGVITASYPRFPGDHAGSFVGAHVAALRALGHDVDVIAANDHWLFAGAGAPDELERGGVRALVAGVGVTARLAARVARRARTWDRAIAHWLVPSAIAALPSRVPLLAIAHGGDVHTLRRLHLLGPVLRALRLRGARVAFVSEELRAIARMPDAIVQPMGVDTAHFAALERAPTSPPTIAVIARLVPIKGVDVALRALAHVRTPAQVVIAGDGPERPALEALAPRAIFLGAVDAARRDDLLRRASVIVVPSRVLPNGRSEGTPMVALEALAAGVPIVATAVGGLRDLPATLVGPDDPLALAAAIDRVLEAPPAIHALPADWRQVTQRLLP